MLSTIASNIDATNRTMTHFFHQRRSRLVTILVLAVSMAIMPRRSHSLLHDALPPSTNEAMIATNAMKNCISSNVTLFSTATKFDPPAVSRARGDSIGVFDGNNSDNGNGRRKFLDSLLVSAMAVATGIPQPSLARNLPTSTGADTSQTGTLQALIPIVNLRDSLSSLLQLTKSSKNTEQVQQFLLENSTIPKDEILFKRIFDTYSNKVSYKQQFLDSNAFLVYYTQGFDGPNRPNIEREEREQQIGSSGSQSDVVNEKQTLQFGLRNDAWIAWENCLLESTYYIDGDDDNDFIDYLNKTIKAVDAYLSLAPPDDLKQAQELKAAKN